ADITVARFGDRTEPDFAAGRMQARRQTEPGGEAARAGKALGITDLGRQSGRGDQANAWNARQSAARRLSRMPPLELRLHRGDLRYERVDLLCEDRQRRTNEPRDALLAFVRRDRAKPFGSFMTARSHDAELRQMAPQGVDQHRALFDQQLARSMQS